METYRTTSSDPWISRAFIAVGLVALACVGVMVFVEKSF